MPRIDFDLAWNKEALPALDLNSMQLVLDQILGNRKKSVSLLFLSSPPPTQAKFIKDGDKASELQIGIASHSS